MEAEAAANLQHPNIVTIHEIGEHEGQHYFTMDFIDGRSLANLARENPLPATQAAGYVREVALAIQYAHDHGILHRDLKPSNVLIDTQDRPHITDFGLAKRIEGDSDLTTAGSSSERRGTCPPNRLQAASRTSARSAMSTRWAPFCTN